MAKKKPDAAPAPEKVAADAKAKRNWTYSWIAVASVGALAIGGMVYYGTVVQPKVNADKDVKACVIFNDGLAAAQASSDYEQYFDKIFTGANDALEASYKDGELHGLIYNVAVLRLNITAEAGAVGAQVVDEGATLVQAKCAIILGVEVPEPTATN